MAGGKAAAVQSASTPTSARSMAMRGEAQLVELW
jgi:hypothetical protein